MEGTLATPDFSSAVWHRGIPSLYAMVHSMEFDEARKIVTAKYDEIGNQRPEWYDIKYWFSRFGLGDHKALLESCRSTISYYTEAKEAFRYFARRYEVVIVSSSTREFLPYLMDGLIQLSGLSNSGKSSFRVFSSISDYGLLKTPPFYLKVCQELGIQPEEMVHVGDSLVFDYLNAGAAGIRAFYLDRLQSSGQPQALKSLLELKNNLSKSVTIK